MVSPLFKVFIPGRPVVKKNSKRMFRGRIMSSEQYMRWEKVAAMEIRKAATEQGIHEPLAGNLHLRATFHFKDRRSEPDLSNLYEGIQDVLQKMRVIKDDKLIQSHDGSRKVFGALAGLYCEVYAWQDEKSEVG